MDHNNMLAAPDALADHLHGQVPLARAERYG